MKMTISTLKEANIIVNKYRVAILSYLSKTKEHPSAESIYREIKKDYPGVSVATIYNNLNTFVENGLINALHTPAGKVLYDGSKDEHAHFYCQKCMKIYDVPTVAIRELESKLTQEDYIIENASLLLEGICPKCRD